jgi:anti-sigma factor RsiW
MAYPADVLIQLSAYLDGELDGAEAGRIAVLLVSNPAISEEYEFLKQICSTLTNWDRIDCSGRLCASPSFEPKLTERLSRLRANGRNSVSNSHSLSTATHN